MTSLSQGSHCEQAKNYWIRRRGLNKNFELWMWMPLVRIVPGQWYDWVDTLTGAFGQCIAEAIVNGEATQPKWRQEPLGWKYRDIKMSENELVEVYKHNERYIILEYLGEFEIKK